MKDIKLINGNFETCMPEEQGISSSAISECLQKIKDSGLFMHSMHIFRNGYMVAGGCANPIKLDAKRRIYSIMKSVTALAIEFHVQDGTFSLDDPIVKYYPQVEFDKNNERLMKLTIRDTLCMMAGHNRNGQREYDQARYGEGAIPISYRDGTQLNIDEIKGKTLPQLFFDLPFVSEPGTEFFYDDAIPEIVGILAENVSGRSYFDYLWEKLFKYLELDYCNCNRIEEYDGTTRNSSPTSVMTLRDMLKIGLFYLQKGSWNGQQLLRKDIVEDATSKHVETREFILNHLDTGFSLDTTAFGYGYQMWMNKYGGFTLWGGNAQVLCCIPEKNLMFSFACFDEREATKPELCLTDIIYDTVIKNMSDEPLEANQQAYKKMLQDFEEWTTAPELNEDSDKLSEVNKKEFDVESNELGINKLKLDAEAATVSFEFKDGHKVDLVYGTKGLFALNKKGLGHTTDGYSTIYTVDPEEVSVSGGWRDDILVLNLHYSAHMNSYTVEISFNNDTAIIK